MEEDGMEVKRLWRLSCLASEGVRQGAERVELLVVWTDAT